MLINLKSPSPALVMYATCLYLFVTVFTLHEPITVKEPLFREYPSLTPACAGFLELRELQRRLLKYTFNAENLYLSCLNLSTAISSQFAIELCAAVKNCRTFIINSFFGGQGRSRLSMLTNLKSLSPVLVMICSMSVPICNRFHTKRANGGKINVFLGGTPI